MLVKSEVHYSLDLFSVDIVDDPSSDSITAIFELPGIPNNEISLQIREGQLVVSGERKAPHSLNRMIRYPIQNLRYGRFSRSIGVPEGTQVSFDDGCGDLFSD